MLLFFYLGDCIAGFSQTGFIKEDFEMKTYKIFHIHINTNITCITNRGFN